MKLYFLRHGLAGHGTRWKGDDRVRPLTPQGKKKMAREAATMAKLNLGINLVITSPLARARETAEIVAERLQIKQLQDERLSPGFNPEQLAAILHDHPRAGALMLVGHEPDFSATIGHLIGDARIVCKKGGLALVDVPNSKDLRGELLWLIPPKLLA